MMKQWIYAAMTALLFSGCATMQVNEMVQKDAVERFKITRITGAYFNPSEERIFLDIELLYSGEKQSLQKCFIFDADAMDKRSGGGITLEAELETECSPIPEAYIAMPIKIGKSYYVPYNGNDGRMKFMPLRIEADRYVLLSNERVDIPFVPWAVYSRYDRAYFVHSPGKKSYPVKVPEEHEVRNPEVYLLYPFSVALDIVTLPVTAVYYIVYLSYDAYFTNAMQP